MLQTGRAPMNEAENAAVDKLALEHEGKAMSLTRRDAGETGPLLVHVDDDSYEIAEDGKRRKVT